MDAMLQEKPHQLFGRLQRGLLDPSNPVRTGGDLSGYLQDNMALEAISAAEWDSNATVVALTSASRLTVAEPLSMKMATMEEAAERRQEANKSVLPGEQVEHQDPFHSQTSDPPSAHTHPLIEAQKMPDHLV